MRIFNGKSLSIAIAAFSFLASAVHAEEKQHETHYSVTFGGLEIGKAKFNIASNGKTYSVNGKGGTSGLASWFAPTTGNVASIGAVSNNALKPQTHSVSVLERKKKPESVKLGFTNERVTDVEIVSAKKRKVRKAPAYIPVEDKHLVSVLDPASPMIIPVNADGTLNGSTVCNNKFPIFDGETRYDIELKYKSTRKIKTSGYKGYAYVCQLRYIPVAGHKKSHRNVKEMAKNKNMELWLAPMSGMSAFTPIKIVIGTKYGRFIAKPTYFGSPT
ncbi:MAG: DUF3108 domain-containing protein [Pseudomonadota bacterium]